MFRKSFLILLASFWVPAVVVAQPPASREIVEEVELTPIGEVPEPWREYVIATRRYYQAILDLAPYVGVIPEDVCRQTYKMEVIIAGDPHLHFNNPANNRPDKFALRGPRPSGKWTVEPVNGAPGSWAHPWVQNTIYFAVPIPVASPAQDTQGRNIRFSLTSVKVGPHGADPEREHEYEMRFTAWRPSEACPDRVEFVNLRHEGGPISDHPGHGGAGRDGP